MDSFAEKMLLPNQKPDRRRLVLSTLSGVAPHYFANLRKARRLQRFTAFRNRLLHWLKHE
jgi:hypothetical protein